MNIIHCPNCDKELIAEEYLNHDCEKLQKPVEKYVTLYYSSFIPLRISGRDVAILVSEDGKTLYNIKPSPGMLRSSKSPDNDDSTQRIDPTLKYSKTGIKNYCKLGSCGFRIGYSLGTRMMPLTL